MDELALFATRLNNTIYFMAWNVLNEMQDHNDPTSTGEMIMKKLFAVAAMAVTFCLAGLVMSGTALAQQCVDNGDGTVTDSGMGLMWQKATAGDMPHQNARNYTESLVLSGHDDWYLPSSDNLVKLFQSSPCRNLMTLPSFWYWSSSGYFYGGVPGYYRVHPSQGIALEYSLSYSFEVLAVRRAR